MWGVPTSSGKGSFSVCLHHYQLIIIIWKWKSELNFFFWLEIILSLKILLKIKRRRSLGGQVGDLRACFKSDTCSIGILGSPLFCPFKVVQCNFLTSNSLIHKNFLYLVEVHEIEIVSFLIQFFLILTWCLLFLKLQILQVQTWRKRSYLEGGPSPIPFYLSRLQICKLHVHS